MTDQRASAALSAGSITITPAPDGPQRAAIIAAFERVATERAARTRSTATPWQQAALREGCGIDDTLEGAR